MAKKESETIENEDTRADIIVRDIDPILPPDLFVSNPKPKVEPNTPLSNKNKYSNIRSPEQNSFGKSSKD